MIDLVAEWVFWFSVGALCIGVIGMIHEWNTHRWNPKLTKEQKAELAHCMALKYETRTRELAPTYGGGYYAWHPQFNQLEISGAGETPEEAVKCLSEVRETIFTLRIKDGFAIPEPKS